MTKLKGILCLLLGLVLFHSTAGGVRAGEETDYKAVLWSHLKNVVEFGPRPPGSPAHANLRQYIKLVGAKYADSVRELSFTYPADNGETLIMHNLELYFEGRDGGRPIILGAHYDTRRFADEDADPANRELPIVGANDGGSGTAELLALAQYFHEHPPRRPVRLVFFDGEDYGKKFTENYFIGSKRYASDMGRLSEDERPLCVLVIDMVGDRDLEIYREVYSNENARWLVDLVFDAAERLEARSFRSKPRYTIRDDHLPFLKLGIAAAVLIDFDYPHWHTQEDTLDKCSEESLYEVFRVVVEAVGLM